MPQVISSDSCGGNGTLIERDLGDGHRTISDLQRCDQCRGDARLARGAATLPGRKAFRASSAIR